jgi:ribosomal protein S27E
MTEQDIKCGYCGKDLFLPDGQVHKCKKGRLCYSCSRLLTAEEIGNVPENIGVFCNSCGKVYFGS